MKSDSFSPARVGKGVACDLIPASHPIVDIDTRAWAVEVHLVGAAKRVCVRWVL